MKLLGKKVGRLGHDPIIQADSTQIERCLMTALKIHQLYQDLESLVVAHAEKEKFLLTIFFPLIGFLSYFLLAIIQGKNTSLVYFFFARHSLEPVSSFVHVKFTHQVKMFAMLRMSAYQIWQSRSHDHLIYLVYVLNFGMYPRYYSLDSLCCNLC